MIAGIFHEGSGLGDQLHRYITVRTLAEEKEYEWMMQNAHQFKGHDFFVNFEISSGPTKNIPTFDKTWNEKYVRENGIDIRSYDPEINFVQDNTIIDGSFEDSKYWGHNLDNINKWLEVESLFIPQDTCVIGFRGGEYASNPDLFLTKDYWEKAVEEMKKKGIKEFEVHTDDPITARQFFPDFNIIDNTPISHSKHLNMGYNWQTIRYAKYAIISNSAFYIIPRNLAHHTIPDAVTIAPRYWARRNTCVWARPACYYKPFTYL